MNASDLIRAGKTLERYEQAQNGNVTLSRLAWYILLALSGIGLSSVLFYVINIVGGM